MAPQAPTALQFEGQGAKNSKRSSSHLIFFCRERYSVCVKRVIYKPNQKTRMKNNQPCTSMETYQFSSAISKDIFNFVVKVDFKTMEEECFVKNRR